MNEIVLQGRGICKSYGSKRNRRQVLFDVDIEDSVGFYFFIFVNSIFALRAEMEFFYAHF